MRDCLLLFVPSKMIIYDVTVFRFILFDPRGEEERILLEILSWVGVLPASPIPDPILD